MKQIKSRIGYVVHVKTPGVGGGETRSYQVAQALGAFGVEVFLYGQAGADPGWWHTVHPHTLQTPVPRGVFQLLQDFTTNRIEVCIERYQFPLFNVGVWTQLIRRKRVILEVHGFPIEEYALVVAQEPESAGRLRKLLTRFPRGFWERIQLLLFRRVDHLIVTSVGTKEIMIRLGVPAAKITTVPNAVDPELFKPREGKIADSRKRLGITPDGAIVLYAGSLSHEELLVVIEAIPAVVDRNAGAHFVFVGPGAAERLALKARQKGVAAERISILPPTEHKEMPALLAAADVVLAPYTIASKRFEKGFHYSPLKLLEALAMNKAIVTIDVEELRQNFGGLPNVYFATSGSVSSWVDLIGGALGVRHDPALAAGRRFILQGHRWADVAGEYFRIIRKVEQGDVQ